MTSSWSDQLAKYLTRAGITCTVVFKKHHSRKKESRKKNCNIFTCKGRCALQTCPVHFTIVVEKEPKNKESPSIFTVYIFGDVNHQSDIDSASRHLREPQRSVMGMFLLTFKPVYQRVFAAQQVNRLGPLAAYERNVRLADENLLQEGNLTQVPSIDVLKTAGQEYNKKYRLDEDMFMEVRIFRELTERLDTSSVKVKGKRYPNMLYIDHWCKDSIIRVVRPGAFSMKVVLCYFNDIDQSRMREACMVEWTDVNICTRRL